MANGLFRGFFARATTGIAVALLLFSLDQAAADGVLRVGTSGDYAPFSIAGTGFDVDVAEAMARDLGLRIEWVRFRWPELRERVRRNDLDVAMGGVTWLPDRAVVGASSRAVAQGGPCVVGDPRAPTIAVNRGGRLERWAREHLPAASVVAIDDNLSLPVLLAGGAAGAYVTDSFEVKTHRPSRAAVRCEPPTERKVYWIAPARASELAPRIDRWLAENESAIDGLRRRWLGGSVPRDDVDDLLDRIARRLELMPAVAAWKRAHERPIEDREREARVVERAVEKARAAGLEAKSVERFFALQIELAKAVQQRSQGGTSSLDLETELRPTIAAIGDEIIASLAAACPVSEQAITDRRLALLQPLLQENELTSLRRAIVGVGCTSR